MVPAKRSLVDFGERHPPALVGVHDVGVDGIDILVCAVAEPMRARHCQGRRRPSGEPATARGLERPQATMGLGIIASAQVDWQMVFVGHDGGRWGGTEEPGVSGRDLRYYVSEARPLGAGVFGFASHSWWGARPQQSGQRTGPPAIAKMS